MTTLEHYEPTMEDLTTHVKMPRGGTIPRLVCVQRWMDRRPKERALIRRVVRSLRKRGYRVAEVDDHEERTRVNGEEDVLTLAYNLDMLYLMVEKDGEDAGYVWLIMGQYPDTIADYTMNLDAAMIEATGAAYDDEPERY